MSSIAMIIGLITDVPSAIGLFTVRSGDIALTYKGEKVENIRERHVIVCLDNVKSASQLTGIYPTFSNNTNYGINNFAMRYTIESQNVMFEPTDYYNMSQEGNGYYVLKYKETMLPAFNTVECPIRKFIVAQNGGKLHLMAQSSYDGIKVPIIYNVYANFYVIPYPSTCSYEEWKRKCQQNFIPNTQGLSECDVYYLTQNNGYEQEINFRLGNITRNTAQTIQQETLSQKQLHENEQRQHKKTEQQTTPKPIYTPQPTITQLPDKTSYSQLPFNLRVSGYKQPEQGDEMVELSINNALCDTTMMMLVLLEDSATHEKSNDLWQIRVIRSNKYSSVQNIYHTVKSGCRLVDYAFCRENKAIGDSITGLDNDSILKNNTLRTIGILAVQNTDSDSYYMTWMLKPKDATNVGKGHRSIDLKNYRKINYTKLQYYELPEDLLIDEYKPIGKYEWLRTTLILSHWFGVGVSAIILVIFLFFVISRIWEERKSISGWKNVAYIIKDEWGATTLAKTLGQLTLVVFTWYITGMLLVLVITVVSHFFF